MELVVYKLLPFDVSVTDFIIQKRHAAIFLLDEGST